MSAFLPRLAALLLVAGALALPARAEDALTHEQKQAVEQIIHDYFVKNPEFMVEVLRAAEAKLKETRAEDGRRAIAANRTALLGDETSPIGGNPQGDVTIVEFFDYRCPYCKQVEPALEALIKDDSKIRVIYKEFPVLGPESVYASHMALAAQKQGKYAVFHRAMMATKGQITEEVILKVAGTSGLDLAKAKADMTSPEVERVIKRNYDLAEALDINGTPAFVIGDALVPGATDLEKLKQLVAEARKQG
jgi:protein-disulfide isomerase